MNAPNPPEGITWRDVVNMVMAPVCILMLSYMLSQVSEMRHDVMNLRLDFATFKAHQEAQNDNVNDHFDQLDQRNEFKPAIRP